MYSRLMSTIRKEIGDTRTAPLPSFLIHYRKRRRYHADPFMASGSADKFDSGAVVVRCRRVLITNRGTGRAGRR